MELSASDKDYIRALEEEQAALKVRAAAADGDKAKVLDARLKDVGTELARAKKEGRTPSSE